MQERYGIKFTFLILKIKIINKIDICILIRLNIALIALISITKDYYYYYLNKLFKCYEHTLRCVFLKAFCCFVFNFKNTLFATY